MTDDKPIILTANEEIALQDAVRAWSDMLSTRFPIAEPWTWHNMTKAAYKRAIKNIAKKVGV